MGIASQGLLVGMTGEVGKGCSAIRWRGLESVTAPITKETRASAVRKGSCEVTASTAQTALSVRTSVTVAWPVSFSASLCPPTTATLNLSVPAHATENPHVPAVCQVFSAESNV